MQNKLFYISVISILCCFQMGTLQATFTLHNKTGTTLLYIAGYHAGDDAVRQTEIVEVLPGSKSGIDVPQTKTLSTKKRYVAIARSKDDLSENLSIQALKALPHINIKSTKTDEDYFVVDKDGRLALYTSIEYSRVGQAVKAGAHKVDKEVTELLIDKEEIPAIKNNKYRSQVAQVTVGSELCKEELEYLAQRKPKVRQALNTLLQSKQMKIAGNVPTIAVVLSGGGNRAMFSSCGYMQGLQEIGLLDATTYIATLSGSTWFLGSWYANGAPRISDFRRKLAEKMKKGFTISSLRVFSLILDTFKIKYAYNQPITAMDLFGALLGAVLLDDFGDDRYHVYLSDQKKVIANGNMPFPIYAAMDGSKLTHKLGHWYEFTPFEVGGVWLDHYVPTWAFGRKFVQGASVDDEPELALAFFLGVFGSAFAVDIYRLWQEIEKTVDASTKIQNAVQKRILNQIGDKRITQCEEFNFTVGMPKSPLRDQKTIILADGGLAANLPYPVVSGERDGRNPDVYIFFVMSRDIGAIQKDIDAVATEFRKTETYARNHNLKFPKITNVQADMITVYKDENDPSVPLVILMPCMLDPKKWTALSQQDKRFDSIKGFDYSSCIENFCATQSFTYSPSQAEKLMTLGQFCAHACKNELIDAIAWKAEQIAGVR